MFAREGNAAATPDVQQLIKTIVAKVPDDQAMSDLDTALVFAKGSRKADLSELAVTGFCWGGRITWLYAAHQPALKAAVAVRVNRPRNALSRATRSM